MPDASAPSLMTFHTVLGDTALRFRGLSAVEELGRPYEFVVQADSDAVDVVLADLLGTPAAVSVQLPDDSRRYFHGLVASAGLDGASGKRCAWRLVLRPWLWLLTRRVDTRIFQGKSVDAILTQVFDAYAHDVAFELSGSYPAFEYCVQYRETDFNFVSRLMEQEGLYYYFRHTGQRHTLVVVDKMSAHAAYPGYASIAFRDSADAATDLESIDQWRTRLEVQPGKVTLRDYDFTRPDTLLESAHPSSRQGAKPAFEHYDPPGDYPDQAQGDRYAGLRMDELDARHRQATGAGNARGIAVGHRFTLQDHPLAAQNAEHVVVSTRIDARHSGYESGQGVVQFGCALPPSSLPTSSAPSAPRPSRACPGRRRPWWWARPATRSTPTNTAASRCSSTGTGWARKTRKARAGCACRIRWPARASA